MIILPAHSGDGALLYIGPREKNVCFQIQLSGALADLPGVHVTDARLLWVQQRWPGQPDEAATAVSSLEFAQLAGVQNDVLTLYVGDGVTQEEGREYELAIGIEVDTTPPGLLCAFLRLPCRRAQPWPSW